MTDQEFIKTPEEKAWTDEDIRRDILQYNDRIIDYLDTATLKHFRENTLKGCIAA